MHKNPIITVKIIPDTYPALKKACGIARIPVPRDPFNMWIRVSELLWKSERLIQDGAGSSSDLLTL